ncbi:MAG: universal stress protein [Cyanobacteria bacterium J06555_13]
MIFHKILVALDPIDPDRDFFDRAVAMAKAADAELLLLSVLTSDGGGMFLKPHPQVAGYNDALNDWNLFQKRYEEYKEGSLSVLRNCAKQATVAGVRASFKQSSGSPGREICRIAKAEEVDLIIVGSRGYRGFDEMLLGSVSNYVAHHAPCSVMMVHPQQGAKLQTESVSKKETTAVVAQAVLEA